MCSFLETQAYGFNRRQLTCPCQVVYSLEHGLCARMVGMVYAVDLKSTGQLIGRASSSLAPGTNYEYTAYVYGSIQHGGLRIKCNLQ